MSESNDLTKTYSGMFGNRVVVNKGKRKSLLTMPPTKPKAELSPKQKQNCERLKLAAVHATMAMEDPDLHAMYAAKATKRKCAYRLASNDYMSRPYINAIETSNYHGKPGDTISVRAGDDFKVVKVTVKLTGSDGNTIEEGTCTLTLPTGAYDYTVTKAVDDIAGITATASAVDIPGNVTQRSITL